MIYNSTIHGLVIRDSTRIANREPIGERASSKLWCPVLAGPYAATKPKARSPMGFLLCGPPLVRARQLIGLHGLNPRNTGSRYLRDLAEQPVREGLRKVYGQSGDKKPVFRVNRGVMRTLGLFIFFQIKEDSWAGSGQIPWVSPLLGLWGSE